MLLFVLLLVLLIHWLALGRPLGWTETKAAFAGARAALAKSRSPGA